MEILKYDNLGRMRFHPEFHDNHGKQHNMDTHSEWNRQKTIEEWLQGYGQQRIPFQPRTQLQIRMAI